MTDPGIVYLDASALVKLIVRVPESGALRTIVRRGARMATSVISVVEVTRAIGRAVAPTPPGIAEIFDGLQLIGLDRPVLVRASALGPPSLRSLDAIHLATAMELAPDLTAFVTYDERLAVAARAHGMAVIAPA